MSFKLRLLLFYVHRITKATTYGDLLPPQIREENKKQAEQIEHLFDFPPIELANIEDRTIEMRDGVAIPIRIYQPNKKQNLPLIVFFHGGGFVLRSIDSHDKACRRFAKISEAVVVSVGYRLAPEHKFPIPTEDAYDATLWVAEHAKSLGGDPDNLILMGDSAGGNLSAVTSIQARNLGKPKIAKQILIYPALDARLNHPSMETLGYDYFLTKELVEWFVNHYKRTDEDILNPMMSPLLTKDLSNLPPALVLTCSLDPLKDEGEAYADRLSAAGNQVYFTEYKDVIHAFMNMPKIMKEVYDLHDDVRDFIQEG